MALLAIAVERASGQSFPDYVAGQILRRLGMSDSAVGLDDSRRARLATGYVYIAPDQAPLVAPDWQLGVGQYTGGLVTTPTDLARFLSTQFPTGDGRRSPVLSQASLRQMQARVGGSEACLGWWTTDLGGHRLIGHTGGHFGFLASVGALPEERLGIAIMTNSWNPVLGANDTWELAKMALLDLARATERPASPPAPPFEPGRVEIARYAGRYALAGGFAHLDVDVRDGQLWFAVREKAGSLRPCEPTGPDRFSCGLEFRVDGEGRVAGVSFALFEFAREP